VQGQLRKEQIRFEIGTECAHCGQPITLEMDSDMKFQVGETEADPYLFVPQVDFDKLEDPSIIDAF
jgi:hypothetical protein